MARKIRRAITRMQRAAQTEMQARQAFNTATRNYLQALDAADGDEAHVARDVKRAVDRTGRAYARSERSKARTKAVFQALSA